MPRRLSPCGDSRRQGCATGPIKAHANRKGVQSELVLMKVWSLSLSRGRSRQGSAAGPPPKDPTCQAHIDSRQVISYLLINYANCMYIWGDRCASSALVYKRQAL